MKVRTKFFAAIKDIVGTPEVELELADGTTAGGLFQHYCEQYAGLQRYVNNTMISVNLEFVSPETRLQEGDEIAFIPPVSGGSEAGSRVSQAEGSAMIDIVESDLALEPLVQHVRKHSNGAVVTFLGVVRGFSRGRNVLYLEYEAYREMAVRKLQQVANEVRENGPSMTSPSCIEWDTWRSASAASPSPLAPRIARPLSKPANMPSTV